MKSQSFVIAVIAAMSVGATGGAASAAPTDDGSATDNLVIAPDGLPVPPGGTQIAPNEWSYEDGRVTLAVPTTDPSGRGAVRAARRPAVHGRVRLPLLGR